jgi:hypothetical protein
MNMLRHNDVGCDIAAIPAPNAFQFAFKDLAGLGRAEQLKALIATERDEVQASLLLCRYRFRDMASHCKSPPYRAKAAR